MRAAPEEKQLGAMPNPPNEVPEAPTTDVVQQKETAESIIQVSDVAVNSNVLVDLNYQYNNNIN